MKDTKKTAQRKPINDEKLAVEWEETVQERIIEGLSRSESARHSCKGPHCDTAFDKL